MTSVVAGVDGCKKGWVAAIGPMDGSTIWLSVASNFASLVDLYPRVAWWAVDMPIGLATDGPRECDRLARKQLGRPRGASVFPAPPLQTLDAASYEHACRIAEAVAGRRISKQAWHLVPKIRDARQPLLAGSRLKTRVFESHPELAFTRLNGCSIQESKKSDTGSEIRKRLLEEEIGRDTVRPLLEQTAELRGVADDDALDALACWTTAARRASNSTATLPENPDLDETGLPMAILW